MSGANASFVDKNDFVYKFGMAQSIIGMVLNTLAWLVILRTKGLHNMTNYLLVYLAVIDSIYCLITFSDNFTMGTIVPVTFIGREMYCRIIESNFASILPTYSSIYGLCLVTYERFIGLVHPLHYPRMMSAKRVSFIIFLSWFVAVLFSSPYLFTLAAGKETNTTCEPIDLSFASMYLMADILSFGFGYFLPIIFMSWAYYRIQATLKRGAQQLQQQNVQGAALELLQARQNVIHMLRIVMGALFVLLTPAMMQVIFCVIPQNKNVCYSENGKLVTTILYYIYDMNSVINPIIYVFKYKKFQKGLQDLVCCCIGRHLKSNQSGVQIAINEQTP